MPWRLKIFVKRDPSSVGLLSVDSWEGRRSTAVAKGSANDVQGYGYASYDGCGYDYLCPRREIVSLHLYDARVSHCGVCGALHIRNNERIVADLTDISRQFGFVAERDIDRARLTCAELGDDRFNLFRKLGVFVGF